MTSVRSFANLLLFFSCISGSPIAARAHAPLSSRTPPPSFTHQQPTSTASILDIALLRYENRAEWRLILSRVEQTRRRRLREMQASLQAMGMASAALLPSCFGEKQCRRISAIEDATTKIPNLRRFKSAYSGATRIFAAYGAGVDTGASLTEPENDIPDDVRPLQSVWMRAQAFRVNSNILVAVAPSLSVTRDERVLIDLMIALAANAADHDGTAIVKRIIAAGTWPGPQIKNEQMQSMIWMTVQHSDDAPDFQAQVLRLMEPLVKSDSYIRKEYAYLWDRVFLLLSGKQKYGTQFTGCEHGRLLPGNLTSPATIDAERASMGLIPVGEYAKKFAPTC